tara:strand:- start:331 stop:888 length:558 start_codon:yes stop_codon:yes gene_type:complete
MNFLKFISISALSFNVLVNAQGYSGPAYESNKHVANIKDLGGPICKRDLAQLQAALLESGHMPTPAEIMAGFPKPTKDESVKVFRHYLSFAENDDPHQLDLQHTNRAARATMMKTERDVKRLVFEVEKEHWDCLKERLKKTFGPFKAAKAASKVGRETYIESLFDGFSEDTTNLTPAIKEYIDNF